MKKVTFFLLLTLFLIQSSSAQLSVKFDPTFGTKGIAKVEDTNTDYIFTAIHRYKGSDDFLAGGIYTNYDIEEDGIFFAKFGANGKLDKTFADNGILFFKYDDFPYNNIIRIREAADKSFLIMLGDAAAIDAEDVGIVCFTAKGKIVTDFGNGGILAPEEGGFADFDILDDGKILTLSNVEDEVKEAFISRYERYSQLGVWDKTYGNDGAVEIGDGFNLFFIMDRHEQGYINCGVGIDLVNESFFPILAKSNGNGVIQKTFGVDGIAKGATQPDTNYFSLPTKLKVLADGSFLVYGYSWDLQDSTNSDNYPTFMTKINKNGTANNSFGNNGYINFLSEVEPSIALNLSIEELNSKKLLVSRSVFSETSEELNGVISLFNADAKLEKQFGKDGELIVRLDNSETGIITSTMTSDGKILFGGGVLNNNNEVFDGIIARVELVFGVGADDKISSLTTASVFPNPTKENTTLTYELSEEATINIELYDMQGRLQQILLNNQTRTIGKQQEHLTFDNQLASGLYLLKIDLGEKGSKMLKVNKI